MEYWTAQKAFRLYFYVHWQTYSQRKATASAANPQTVYSPYICHSPVSHCKLQYIPYRNSPLSAPPHSSFSAQYPAQHHLGSSKVNRYCPIPAQQNNPDYGKHPCLWF